MVMKIKIKPLSINEAWAGRRFKTPKYKAFEEELLLKLKPMDVPEGKLSISILYGMSNMQSDVDNPTKTFVDVLQKKYGFNDNKIYAMVLVKEKVAKGEEFIEFSLDEYNG